MSRCPFGPEGGCYPTNQPLGVCILDPELCVLFVASGLADHLGLGTQDLLGQPLIGLIDAGEAKSLEQRLKTQSTVGLQLPVSLLGSHRRLETLAIFQPLAGQMGRGYWLAAFYPLDFLTPHLDRAKPSLPQGHSAAHALTMLAAVPHPIALLDRGCRLLAANPPFLALLGAEQSASKSLGRPLLALDLDPALIGLVYRHLSRCLDHGERVNEWVSWTTAEGRERDYQVSLIPDWAKRGTSASLTLLIQDITAARQAERRLLQSKAVHAATSEGIVITDPKGIVIAVNPAFTRITGYAESEVLGQKPYPLNAQWHTRAFFIRLWRQLRKWGRWQGEVWSRHKGGEVYRQRLTICRVLDQTGRLSNFVMLLAERGAHLGLSRPSASLIHYDPLTRLPNRLLFELRLEHAIAQRARRGTLLAVLMIDLDHFSHINASLGYRIGDELLRTVALKLRELIHPSDTLARLHADRFALLLEAVETAEELTRLAEHIRAWMERPIWVRGYGLYVNLSIGIALMTELGEDAQTLISRAEFDLRQAKRHRHNAALTSPISALAQVRSSQQGWTERLRAALEQLEFQIRYYPGCDMNNGHYDAVEAIPHWNPSDLGPVTTERLWTLAEESGLSRTLGEWLLAKSCEQFARWIDSGLAPDRLVIAIGETQCLEGNLLRSVEHQLLKHPLLVKHLDLAFSEHLLVKHYEALADLFQKLNELGVGIWISEVGLGWTSPALLQRLPIRALKIHSNFIEALPQGYHELAVIETLIAMAQALKIEIRADGVRTVEQQYQLLNLGCAKGQGDLFGGVMPAPAFEEWLNANRVAPLIALEH